MSIPPATTPSAGRQSPANPATSPGFERNARTSRNSRGPALVGWLLIVLGALLAIAGVALIALGGSWYYTVAGVWMAASGWLLLQRRSLALTVYGLFVAATLVWSLWEAGLDWWPLAARMDVPFLLGMVLLMPWVTRPLGPEPVSIKRSAGLTLAVPLLLFAVIAVASWIYDPHTIKGEAAERAAPAGSVVGTGDPVPQDEWHAYGRTGFGQRHSPLTQITPDNVRGLEVAWQFRTGDFRGKEGDPEETTFQVTPLKVGNRLFICTPHQSVIALDATTGAQIWRHEAGMADKMALQHLTCRGLSYSPGVAISASGASAASAVSPAPVAASAVTGSTPASLVACTARLFMPTADGRLLALDPDTGRPCTGFGGEGHIDLWAGMPNHSPGAYYSTSPVVVTRNLLIVGGTVLDNVSTREQSGVIRAFDINTGALVWNWDSARPDDTAPLAPGQKYTPNSPNSWSISAVDETLGMVYIPMGNQPPDQWGGNRSPAVEKHSSSVVALDLATGKVRWNFQTVHHDLWDYDVPSQPSLIDLSINGATVPALVQPTKQGELFVLDRRTGEPVLPVTEVAAPQGAAKGDRTAPTQPRSALSFDPPALRSRDMWGATMFDQLACRIQFHRLRYEGRFTPPSEQGSLIYPGNFGVFNWGSVAVDPARQTVFTTPTHLAFVSKLIPRPDATSLMVNPEPPKGGLPALNENFGAPFAIKMSPFLSQLGVPCQEPPWGLVAGADLTTGKVIWQHRNGTVRDLSPLPVPFKMGVPSLGGPVATASGLAFLSGTLDYYVRAYDMRNGTELWKARLPAGGQATPMTYTGGDGRQYVVVVAGGHGSLGTKPGDHVIAYALPKK